MWIILFVMIVLVGIALIYLNTRKNFNNKSKNKNEIEIAVINKNNDDNSFPLIQIVENNNIVPLESNKIIDKKIKDEISKVDNGLINTLRAGKNLKEGTELIKNSKNVYSTVVEKGTNLMNAENGQKYGAIINQKTGKITGQTKLTNQSSLVQNAGTNALVNAGMNTATMIVGQYYMNEINNKLEEIQSNISEISDYLDSEYQGKFMFIISKLKEIIDNKGEILSNEFSTQKRYDEVIDLEKECTVLLGQANEELKKNIKNENIEYKEYEKTTKIISKWFVRQQLLQKLLLEINNLRYALSKGNESSYLSHTQYNTYLKLTNQINEQLENYHKNLSKKFGVDISNFRRNGNWLQQKVAGKFNRDWKYNKINESTVKIISSQSEIEKLYPYEKQKQDEVIKIQRFNGEYYNLFENKE